MPDPGSSPGQALIRHPGVFWIALRFLLKNALRARLLPERQLLGCLIAVVIVASFRRTFFHHEVHEGRSYHMILRDLRVLRG